MLEWIHGHNLGSDGRQLSWIVDADPVWTLNPKP